MHENRFAKAISLAFAIYIERLVSPLLYTSRNEDVEPNLWIQADSAAKFPI